MKHPKSYLKHILWALLLLLGFWLLIGSSQPVQSQPKCPPGFSFSPNSGVGCVQDNCYSIGFMDYTGHCVCPEGQTGCYEEVDYDTFDINLCFPNCPYSRLVSCVAAGTSCPNSRMEQEQGVPRDREIDFDLLEKIYDDIIPLVDKLKPELIITDILDEWLQDERDDPSYLDDPIPAVEMMDDINAGFTAELNCNEDPLPEDGINCRVIIKEGEVAHAYAVNWVMDGYVVKATMIPSGSDPFSFPNPPPGTHTITVQAVNQTDGTTRVSTALVNVQFVEGAKLNPWLPAGAGAGSIAVLGGWLWAEWLANKRQVEQQKIQEELDDEALFRSRQDWYEKQMEINDEQRAIRQLREVQQNQIEAEWKRFRDALVKITDEYHKSDYVLDLYDDMYTSVYRDGKWDAKELVRLQELVNTHLQMDRQKEAIEAWQRKVQSLQDRQKSFNGVMNSWTALGLRLITGIATMGASEMVWMPASATANAIYAAERAELLGLRGWDAAKSVMIEAGTKLGIEYLFGKFVQYGLSLVGKGGKWLIGPERLDQVGKWWGQTMSKMTSPKPTSKLPVIHQNWGRGPQVFVNQPIYKPGPIPPVDLGMHNYLNNHIRPISNSLANNIADMYSKGVKLDRNLNNLIKAGGGYEITPANAAAIKVMNNPAYKLAVNQGLVPTTTQQFIYQTRDKLCKNAMMEAFKRLDQINVGGNPASSYVQSVTVSGTGAKPLSPGGIGRFTDFDSTVTAGETALEQRVERLFSNTYHQALQEQGVRAKIAEVTMFPGAHPNPVMPSPEAYTSAPLVHWQKVDMVFRGQMVKRLPNGTVMFNAHPDVAPPSGFGPIGTPSQYPVAPMDTLSVANRIVTHHANQHLLNHGLPMNPEQILRSEGKIVMRVWKTMNTGKGLQPPAWINRLQEIKNNPQIQLSPAETRQLWQRFTRYIDLPENFGG